MKRLICTLCVVGLMTGVATGQPVWPPFSAPVTPGDADDNSPGKTKAEAGAKAQAFVALSELAGADVKNAQGEELGEIEEVLVDRRTGRAFAAMGIGGKRQAIVPVQALQVTGTGRSIQVTLNKSKAELESGPSIAQKQWKELEAPGFAKRVLAHYRLGIERAVGGGTLEEQ